MRAIVVAGPYGATPDVLGTRFAGISRSTLNRRLRDLVAEGRIKSIGKGPGIRYVSGVQFPEEDVRRYFETDWQARPSVGFREEQLLPEPGIAPEKAARLRKLNAISRPLDRKFLADFLIDLSWASSLLEGGAYSAIDTQALIEYGQRNPDKPVEDALLILNHKNAIEYLWAHRELAVETLCRLHFLLTDRHGLAEAADSEHFLPDGQRGVPRENEEVRLGRSAYGPPFRPGYVLGMSAFYELGDIQIIERVFIQGYVRSIVRGSDLPASVRVGGFKVEEVAGEPVKYVQSGRMPDHSAAALFLA